MGEKTDKSWLIPEEFSLGGMTYRVEGVEEMGHGAEYGCMDPGVNKIYLSETWHGKSVSPERKEEVFFHELTHAVLDAMGKEDLNGDEEFVDSFAVLLHQALKTGGYKINRVEP